MLWVKTVRGLQCIPFYALPIRSVEISRSGDLSQEELTKLLTLITAGKEFGNKYGNIRFNFGNNMPTNFENPVAFDYVPNKLKECVGSIRQICDSNVNELKQFYNFGLDIPFVNTPVDAADDTYSEALKHEPTMQELYDLPENDMKAPSMGAGLESIL